MKKVVGPRLGDEGNLSYAAEPFAARYDVRTKRVKGRQPSISFIYSDGRFLTDGGKELWKSYAEWSRDHVAVQALKKEERDKKKRGVPFDPVPVAEYPTFIKSDAVSLNTSSGVRVVSRPKSYGLETVSDCRDFFGSFGVACWHFVETQLKAKARRCAQRLVVMVSAPISSASRICQPWQFGLRYPDFENHLRTYDTFRRMLLPIDGQYVDGLWRQAVLWQLCGLVQNRTDEVGHVLRSEGPVELYSPAGFEVGLELAKKYGSERFCI